MTEAGIGAVPETESEMSPPIVREQGVLISRTLNLMNENPKVKISLVSPLAKVHLVALLLIVNRLLLRLPVTGQFSSQDLPANASDAAGALERAAL